MVNKIVTQFYFRKLIMSTVTGNGIAERMGYGCVHVHFIG
jgi:hypothetical protein